MYATSVCFWNKKTSPLLFNFGFECPIQSVKANKDVLNLRGTYQHLIYTDDVKVGGSIHTSHKYKEALLFASKEKGLEVKAEKTKSILMCHAQNADKTTP